MIYIYANVFFHIYVHICTPNSKEYILQNLIIYDYRSMILMRVYAHMGEVL